LRLLRSMHPQTERFILYVDGARYYKSPVVKEWLKRHPEFHLSRIPAYSPNVNLIERMWKFMRAQALCRWHKTFADMQAAVSDSPFTVNLSRTPPDQWLWSQGSVATTHRFSFLFSDSRASCLVAGRHVLQQPSQFFFPNCF